MPAERLDIVFDFASVAEDSRIIVKNLLCDSPFSGDSSFSGDLPCLNPENGDVFKNRRTDRVMAFDICTPLNKDIEDNFNAEQCCSHYARNENPVDKVRKLGLFEGKDEYGRLQPMLGTAEPVPVAPNDPKNNVYIGGTMPWHQPISENPELGSTEIWEIYNATEDAHPIHVHLVHFDILDRSDFTATKVSQAVIQHNGSVAKGFHLENIAITPNTTTEAPATEQAPKDMVIAYPQQVTRIKMTFDKAGRYVWHCHILSHEDHDMMRPMHIGTMESNTEE